VRILVAGVGNLFLGDDAFGVEVVQQLLRSKSRSRRA
jgi:Ni,Fe-hydrogenase maturation factor